MGLREEARSRRLANHASICTVALLADGVAQPVDSESLVRRPDRADWLDVVNDMDPETRVPASELARALRDRNVLITQDTIQRHRRRECHCVGEYEARPVVPSR